jgi:hypothetical protein
MVVLVIKHPTYEILVNHSFLLKIFVFPMVVMHYCVKDTFIGYLFVLKLALNTQHNDISHNESQCNSKKSSVDSNNLAYSALCHYAEWYPY